MYDTAMSQDNVFLLVTTVNCLFCTNLLVFVYDVAILIVTISATTQKEASVHSETMTLYYVL